MTTPLTGERLDPPSAGRSFLIWPMVVVLIGSLIGVSFSQGWLSLHPARANDGFTLPSGQQMSGQDLTDIVRKTRRECLATKAFGHWPITGHSESLDDWCEYVVVVGGCTVLTGATMEACRETWKTTQQLKPGLFWWK